jgi:hypothetical protein
MVGDICTAASARSVSALVGRLRLCLRLPHGNGDGVAAVATSYCRRALQSCLLLHPLCILSGVGGSCSGGSGTPTGRRRIDFTSGVDTSEASAVVIAVVAPVPALVLLAMTS